jgi:hypothetical protein
MSIGDRRLAAAWNLGHRIAPRSSDFRVSEVFTTDIAGAKPLDTGTPRLLSLLNFVDELGRVVANLALTDLLAGAVVAH